ncbi:DMT family transporter [Tamlana sp. 2_MG-2023]|uniref:DMT family transporter n=1 Tax=unclassified Tamlana TaxID=2614803 RepID=UPI0026E415BA|nr:MULTISPECIES: DMT family transporter [unclassified Tamlana]MDO6760613.1 DMT family transporter [Tamlana sp. 2_MG-2023]MDO6790869.1 DMT family transporter [Tamlana sp. 1_MG-2023]
MVKSNIIKAHLALFGTHVIYAANHFIAKGIMPEKLDPRPFVLFRVVGAGLLFWFIKMFIKEKVEKKDFLRLVLCGLFGASCNQLFFFEGLSLTSPVDTSIIMTSSPTVVFILSMIFLKEKTSTNKLIGLSLGAVGAVGLVWYGHVAEGTSSFLGNLFVFLNVVFFSLYQVVVKPLMKKYHFITIISWVFLFGLLFVIPVGLNDAIFNTDYELFNLNTWLTVAYVIVFTTFLTFLFNIYALRQVSPSVAGSYTYIQPAVSFAIVLMLSYFLNDNTYSEDINTIKIMSCLLVIVGVYLISKKSKKAVN